MPALTEVASELRECPNCRSEYDIETMVEPEVDGDHRYWECEECGFAFGYEKIEEGVRIEGNCSIGVPESVRRAASEPMLRAMNADGTVNLGLPALRLGVKKDV